MKNIILDNEEKQTTLKIGEIHPNTIGRYPYEMVDIDELEESIRQLGLLSPITVIGKNGYYKILSGHRRFTALKQLYKNDGLSDEEIKATEVPCLIASSDDINPIIEELAVEMANTEVRDSSDLFRHRWQVIQLLHELVNQGVIKERAVTKHISETFGFTPRFARMYHTIYDNGCESLLKAVVSRSDTADSKSGTHVHISVSIASQIANKPVEAQEKIIRDIDCGTDPETALNKYKTRNLNTTPDHDISEDYGMDINPDNDSSDDFDDFDMDNASLEECLAYLDEHAIDLDSDIDTTNRIRDLKRDNGRSLYEVEREKTRLWVERMAQLNNPSRLPEADKEILQDILDLNDHFKYLLDED